MRRSDALPERAAVPPLLPWQVHILALVLGILAHRHALAAGVCAVLLYIVATLLRGWRPSLPAYLLAFLLGLLLAAWRMPIVPQGEPDWMAAGEKVRVTGRVLATETRESQRLLVVLGDVLCFPAHGEPQELPGKLVWTWQNPGPVDHWPGPGQQASFTAKIWPARSFANPGAWDTRFYWARQGVFHRAYVRGKNAPVLLEGEPSWPWRARQALRGRLMELSAPLEGWQGRALFMALVTGDRFLLERETRADMSDASVAHVLALSGLHLGIVAGMGWMMAWGVGRLWPGIYLRLPRPRLAVLFGLPLVLLYLWLGGATPSLMRAAVMFASWGLLLWLGRGRVLMDGLFLALVVILAWDPLMAHDLGLQMSLTAVAGMGLAMPLLFGWAGRLAGQLPDRLRGPGAALAKALAISLAANLALLPIMLVTFGQLGAGLYWNLIWVPLLSLVIMPLGFLGLVLALLPGFSPAASQIFVLDAAILEGLMVLLRWAKGSGLVPVLTCTIPLWSQAAGYWLMLVYAFTTLRPPGAPSAAPHPRLPASRQRLLVLLIFILLAGPVLWQVLQPGRPLQLTVLDVGQGQCILLETPRGDRYLLDGGGTSSPGFDVGQAVVAKVLARNRPANLTGIILSHPETDHMRGLIHIVRHFKVGFFASSGDWGQSSYAVELQQALQERGVEQRVWHAGMPHELGDGLGLEVLHPRPPGQGGPRRGNNGSLAVRLVWHGQGLALLPGDLEKSGLRAMLAYNDEVRSQALVLPHHGSNSSYLPELYERASPRLALASSGYLNRWGFPGREVRAGLEAQGVPLLSTSDCGAMTLTWNDPMSEARLDTYLECGN